VGGGLEAGPVSAVRVTRHALERYRDRFAPTATADDLHRVAAAARPATAAEAARWGLGGEAAVDDARGCVLLFRGGDARGALPEGGRALVTVLPLALVEMVAWTEQVVEGWPWKRRRRT
jgi:hypothetical protein